MIFFIKVAAFLRKRIMRSCLLDDPRDQFQITSDTLSMLIFEYVVDVKKWEKKEGECHTSNRCGEIITLYYHPLARVDSVESII